MNWLLKEKEKERESDIFESAWMELYYKFCFSFQLIDKKKMSKSNLKRYKQLKNLFEEGY